MPWATDRTGGVMWALQGHIQGSGEVETSVEFPRVIRWKCPA